MAVDWAAQQKLVDPYNFITAEAFFKNLDRVASNGEQASTVVDFSFNDRDPLDARQLVLKFDNGRSLSLRFVRPRVWLIRCNFESQDPSRPEESTYVTQLRLWSSCAPFFSTLDICIQPL